MLNTDQVHGLLNKLQTDQPADQTDPELSVGASVELAGA
jgi:hypothetical protein